MIVCPNCSRENEDHYKFCLGCGTELSKALAAPAPATPPTPTTPAPVPTALPQPSALVARPRTPTEPPAPPPMPADLDDDDMPPPVADGSEETDDDVPVPTDISTDLPFDLSTNGFGHETINEPPPQMAPKQSRPVGRPTPRAAVPAVTPTPSAIPSRPSSPPRSATSPDSRICHSCGAVVPEGFKFCGVCGTRYEATRQALDDYAPTPVSGESAAMLVLIHPDGTEGDRFGLGLGETTVGRSHEAPLFAEDPFLSPRHATFFFVKNQLFVRDDGSLNGVFIRIKAEIELFHWDMFRIGQQLLRFEEMSQVRPVQPGAGDGTTVMGSPLRGAWGRLSSVVAIDTTASVWNLRKPEEHIGRERGDLVFPEDGFVSGAHCRLITRDGRYFLADHQSTNGSYLRIKGEGILAPGDLILLGQQLFKIEMQG